MLHRPDQPDAALDLAIVEHDAGARNLHGGAARLRSLTSSFPRPIGQQAERLVERHRAIALALRDRQQRRFGAVPGWV